MTQRPLVKVIVAGGRDFDDYAALEEKLDYMLSKLYTTHDIEIVCGGAKGADALGKQYAERHANIGIGLKIMNADWERYKKSAGYIRNTEMAEYATHLVAFWDGVSRGTAHMITTARDKELKVCVVGY